MAAMARAKSYLELVATGFFLVSHEGAEAQGPGPSFAVFPGHKQKARSKVEQYPYWMPALAGRDHASPKFYVVIRSSAFLRY